MTANIKSKSINVNGASREDVVTILEQFQKENSDLYISYMACNGHHKYDSKTNKRTEEYIWNGSCTLTASSIIDDTDNYI